MAKYANPGEMRVPVMIERPETEINSNGIPSEKWENVFGKDKSVRTKWVNVHGTDVFQALNIDLREPATLTMRYSPKITRECRLIKAEDAGKENREELCYEIISIDDIEERHIQMEIKVQRWRNAK